MGILKSGVLGPFRNKVGPAIGRRHMSQNLLLPLPHPSNKPATAKQLEAQEKLGLLSSFLNRIDKLVNPGFKAYTKHNSPVNAAFKYNYDHAFVKQGETFLLNYPKLVYSRGHILAPEGAALSSAGSKITFSWQPQNQSAYCQFSDKASFLVFNAVKEKGFVIILQHTVNRYAGSFELEVPEDFAGHPVHCYMSFSSADGKKQGDSLYVGEVVVA